MIIKAFNKIKKALDTAANTCGDTAESLRESVWDTMELLKNGYKKASEALKLHIQQKKAGAPERNEALDKISDFYEGALDGVYVKMDAAERFLRKHCKAAARAAGAAAACFFVFCGTVNACTVYTYYYHGTELGTVKYKSMVEEASAQLRDAVQEEKNVDLEIIAEPEVDITYTRAIVPMSQGDSEEEVIDKLSNCSELEGEGYAIKADGSVIAYVDSEDTANHVLDKIKENYCTEAQNPEEISMTMSAGEFNAYMDEVQSESDELKEAYMQSEETGGDAEGGEASDGSAAEDEEQDEGQAAEQGEKISEEELEAAEQDSAEENPVEVEFSYKPISKEGITVDNVIFEEKVTVEPVKTKVAEFVDYDRAAEVMMNEDGSSRVLTVSTTEVITYPEEIPFNVVKQETDELYEGEARIDTVGLNGIKEVTARLLTTDGGEETQDTCETEIVRETVIMEPIDEIILIGTAKKPEPVVKDEYGYYSGSAGSAGGSYSGYSAEYRGSIDVHADGNFVAPVSGTLTSPFGPRWGSVHTGVDIANSFGTPVSAADDGTVIYAQMTPSYGNLVKIDHGNGFVTYYAHNSSFNVSPGDVVKQGDVVAFMGSTGDSTGNHCHFEIRYNGEALNPLEYIELY